MQKKTIIFGAPKEFVSAKIVEALQEMNFEVADVCLDQNFKYPDFKSRVKNFFNKTFFKDTSIKKQLKFQANEKQIRSELSRLENKADFVLIIRPDIYPLKFIEEIKTKAGLLIGYQWDGLERFPDIKHYIGKFDRFFVFDPKDVGKNTFPLTNFYLDNNYGADKTAEKEVFFVGSYLKERFEPLKNLALKLKALNFEPKFYIRTAKKKIIEENKGLPIIFFKNLMSYEENQSNFKKAGVVLDLVSSVHNGLSFRVFEAIGNDKKLITNNLEVKKYDFYHPDNFYVWEDENFEGLEDFLKKPYVMPSKELKERYSFSNWIRYVLDIEPHQKIELPKP